jgi:hypothetical protein
MPPQELLRRWLDYDPDTGVFRWKWRDDVYPPVNGKCAGKIAGAKGVKYWAIGINGKLYYAHALAWVYMHGPIPDDMEIDHIDRNKDNNRIDNLRLASRSQNKGNMSKYANNTSGFKGVYRNSGGGWDARIRQAGKMIYIGHFPNREDAASAYDVAAREIWSEYAWTNDDQRKVGDSTNGA